MRILTLNEAGLVAGGRSVQPNMIIGPGSGGYGGDSYGGYGGGYGIAGVGGYSGGGGGYSGIEISFNPSDPQVFDTVPISSNVSTLPTVNVTAPVNTSSEPNAFDAFVDDIAGAAAASMCAYGSAGAGTFTCAAFGVGVADFLKSNQGFINSVHTAGAWQCAKLGNCYEYDRANGIK